MLAIGLLTVILVATACSNGGIDSLTEGLKRLEIVEIKGSGKVKPSEGMHEYEEGTIVDLTAEPDQGWEFYAWTGEDADRVKEDQSEETTIVMDEDSKISAFFAGEDEEYQDMSIEEKSFQGAEGQAEDLTGHPPYPPGFEVELKAEPEDEEKYTFLNWAVIFETDDGEQIKVDPSKYFENYEAEKTKFTVPDPEEEISQQLSNELGITAETSKARAKVIPYFTTRTEPKEEGEFDFDHNNFGEQRTGEVGLTEHYWDISNLETGEEISFYFHSRNIPDRFTIFYGDWQNMEEVFASSWVSLKPDKYEEEYPDRYPEGVNSHDWHEKVKLSEKIMFDGNSGGVYEGIIEKEAGKNVLKVKVLGKDEGTIWDYIIEKSE